MSADLVLREERAARLAAERDAERLAKLQALTAAFSESLTPYDVASVALLGGGATLGAARGSVFLVGEGGAALEALRLVGYSEEAEARWRRILLTEDLPFADAARSGVALIFETMASAGSVYKDLPFENEAEDHAFAALPLVVDGRILGVLGLVWDAGRRFDGDEQTFLASLARLCAQALDRASLYDELARARADAEAAGRAKDDFLSNVSHELRTPLTAILGWINMLRTRSMEPAAVARALVTVERNAITQARLIEDILDVARIAANKLHIATSLVEAGAVVRAALDLVRPTAEAGGVQIEAEIDGAIGTIAADPLRLQQIAVNLLSNAVKFTPRGGRIELSFDRRGGDVVLRVKDTGKGIDAAFLPHVFERFRQAEEGYARAHGGLGLGLAIVKHIVELHEGTIAAESEGPGRGATFTVTLPARVQPGATPSGDRATPTPPPLGCVRVLVVDDNEDARDLIAEILDRQGAIVSTASCAEEAILAVERAPPDVLVSDVGMPDQDGYALLRRVRAMSAVPALALTAYAGVHDAAMARIAGFDGYLAKPVAPAKLIDAVARLAGRI